MIEIRDYREMQNATPEVDMHPALKNTNITVNAHVRDLQRAMHPERRKRLRLPRVARIRQSR